MLTVTASHVKAKSLVYKSLQPRTGIGDRQVTLFLITTTAFSSARGIPDIVPALGSTALARNAMRSASPLALKCTDALDSV
jgi:hypothetical protein